MAGAGHSGVLLAGEIQRENHLDWIGFVDDDRHLQGRSILGRRVLGEAADPPTVLRDHEVDEVILCMPSVSLARRRETPVYLR